MLTSLPFHIPLTEAIISHRGTLERVHILNRVGAVACVKTLQKLIKDVVKTREEEGIDKELTPGAFRVLSIDNIDILQSHAHVYVCQSESIWHGTSIQCVEPMPHTAQAMSLPTPTVPKILLAIQDNSITPPQSPIGRITCQTKRHTLSLAGTPSQCQICKRLRGSRPILSTPVREVIPTPGSKVPERSPIPGTTVPERSPLPGTTVPERSPIPGTTVLEGIPTPGTTHLVVGPDAYNSTCQNAPTRATKTIGDLEVNDFTLGNAEIKVFGTINRQ